MNYDYLKAFETGINRLKLIHQAEGDQYKIQCYYFSLLCITNSDARRLMVMQQALEVFLKSDRSLDNKNCPKTRQETYNFLKNRIQIYKKNIATQYRKVMKEKEKHNTNKIKTSFFSSIWQAVKPLFLLNQNEKKIQTQYNEKGIKQKEIDDSIKKSFRLIKIYNKKSISKIKSMIYRQIQSKIKKYQKIKKRFAIAIEQTLF